MEVHTQSLSNFDLQSKGACSYPVSDVVFSDEMYCPEMPASSYKDDASVCNGSGTDSHTAAAAAAEVDGFEAHICANGENGSSVADVGFVPTFVLNDASSISPDPQIGGSPHSTAALKVQKVYRSYRTRRRLADCAVVAEEFWRKAIDFVRLNHSTISFFGHPQTATSRWGRAGLNASKVGKGLSIDPRAQKLAFQHWIEAIDPRHRYGHDLHMYFEVWCKSDAGQPFFYWLDIGDGKELDLEVCPRSKLREHCIKYLGPQEREQYEYIIKDGKIVHKKTEELLDTRNKGLQHGKWIFVMSTSKQLYAGVKKKGSFHHSSFLAGGATFTAGRLEAEHGVLMSVSSYSGHYRPNDDNLESFISFLEKQEVNLDGVQVRKGKDDSDHYDSMPNEDGTAANVSKDDEYPGLFAPEDNNTVPASAKVEESKPEPESCFQRTLSGGLQSPVTQVPETAILKRINSKRGAKSYQLGHQLSLRWCTGAGPRIGCVADYPLELRQQALEFVELSPRSPPKPSSYRPVAALVSSTRHPISFSKNGDGNFE